jgi:class 3 adenylate cyclase
VAPRFFQILAEGVHRFEGTVNENRGDGIMALFGAPIAHEDHALRACYAAFHLEDELRRYAEELKRRRGVSFSVRMAPAARGGAGLVAAHGHGPLRVTLVPAQDFSSCGPFDRQPGALGRG